MAQADNLTSSDFKKVPPKTIAEFRKGTDDAEIAIPELPKNRKCTDVIFLIILIVIILITICVTITAVLTTDKNITMHGYDKCGDICGTNNTPIPEIECSGKDLTGKDIMKMKYYTAEQVTLPDSCVEKCEPPNRISFGRCVPENTINLDVSADVWRFTWELLKDIKMSAAQICVMCLTGIILVAILFICFACNTKVTLICALVVPLGALIAATAYGWYITLKNNLEDRYEVSAAIILSLFLVFAGILFCCYCRKFKFIIIIYEEAVRASIKNPLVLLSPLLTFIILSLVLSSYCCLVVWLSSRRRLEQSELVPSVYEYKYTEIIGISTGLIFVLGMWLVLLIDGWQCMIIAGAVAAYYFARTKSDARYAVFTSMYVSVRYHLGTVAFGSFILIVANILRIVMEALAEKIHSGLKAVLQCCCYCCFQFMHYITKKAYIQTAMHGKPLCTSGKRAARLIWINLLDSVGLDGLAYFIVYFALFAILVIAIIVGCVMNSTDSWIGVVVGGVASFIIVYLLMQVLVVAVGTIFLCFCEDQLLNNGNDRPYFMSSELANTINKAKTQAGQAD